MGARRARSNNNLLLGDLTPATLSRPRYRGAVSCSTQILDGSLRAQQFCISSHRSVDADVCGRRCTEVGLTERDEIGIGCCPIS